MFAKDVSCKSCRRMAMVATVLGWCGGAQAAGTLYFVDLFNPTFDDGALRRIGTDGSDLQTILNTGSGPRAMAVDSGAGKMYWTDVNTYQILRADLNGTNVEPLVTSGLAFPMALALDVDNGTFYWGDQTVEVIGIANLDGSNARPLVFTPFHSGLALDKVEGHLYWTTTITASSGLIRRCRLDGSSVQTVVFGVGKPGRLALDVAARRMYWTDYVEDVVRSANLDGTGVQILYDAQANLNPDGIAVDPLAGLVYWGQSIQDNREAILQMDFTGMGIQQVAPRSGLIAWISLAPEVCTGQAPVITTQPRSVEACEGTAVTLNVAVSGAPLPQFQWRKNGVGIAGATTDMLVLPAARPLDGGAYDVLVRNACGEVISDAAVVVIWPIGTGDINGDGVVNGADVAGFLETLAGGAEQPPTQAFCAADTNRDGQVTASDISLIVALLLGL